MTTEKEKMIAGLIYDANYDQELIDARAAAKELCYDFNHARPSEEAKRQGIIRQLLGKTGNQFEITGPFYCDYGFNIEIGENFYANHNLVILDGAKVTFGDNVFVAPDCGFYTAGHPLDADRRNKGLEYAKPITVGNNVWFGGGVKVMPGVTIGDGAVIGGGSVVTKDIPANMIAFGNPCKPIREITEADARRDG
ncbi:sugar O-acetyltransferase [Aerococcus urinaeequi]|uniref:sugar O-acetyltransferase n=1 Tax=Aerococcus urinaeequi TaxID=51665 RepID=UPI003D6AB24F